MFGEVPPNLLVTGLLSWLVRTKQPMEILMLRLESTRSIVASLPMDTVKSTLDTRFESNVLTADVMEHLASAIPKQWESIVVLEEMLVPEVLNSVLLLSPLARQHI